LQAAPQGAAFSVRAWPADGTNVRQTHCCPKDVTHPPHLQELTMNFSNLLHWAIIFLVVAIVAALLGFGGVAGTAMEGAKIVFWIAIIVAVISFAVSLMRKA
jgi:uncharacterized membrane protein YtjA (UPF0391 family)